MNKIYLRRKNKLVLAPSLILEHFPSHVATILKNIESLGYTLSKDIIDILYTQSVSNLEKFYFFLIPELKKMVGAHVKYKPMYPNFPKQVMEASNVELYINAILHYWSGGTIVPNYEKEERLPLFDGTKLKVISLGTEADFWSIFTNLVSSKTSISATDKEDIEWFVNNSSSTKLDNLMPEEIPLKENAAFVSKLLVERFGPHASFLYKYIKTATDVLRLAVALSNGDVSLAKVTKFRNFKRVERQLLLTLLNRCNSNLEEEMIKYKNRWIRLGEKLHPGDYRKTHERSLDAFDKLRNNAKVWTFNGKIQNAIGKNRTQEAILLLKDRPGEFARKLDVLLRMNASDIPWILKDFESVTDKVSTPVLLQVKEHFSHRYYSKELRAFFPKGNIANAYGIDDNLVPLDLHTCELVVKICEDALKQTYSKRGPMGNVYIDPRLQDYLVPFSQRSASKSLKTITRGSKLPIGEDIKTIRAFLYWKQPKDERVDLDLSAALYDENWVYKDVVSYYNLRTTGGGRGGYGRYDDKKDVGYNACHSGDIVSAPNGASEFIDVDIDSFLNSRIRYIVLSVNSFTQTPFVDLPECFMGWMSRISPGSGEIYEPKTVGMKFDITSDSQISIPMIIDLKERKMIWADLSLKRNPIGPNNVHDNKKGIVLMGRALSSLNKPNLYDLFHLNAISRGSIVEDVMKADTVFTVDSFDNLNIKGVNWVTPFDFDIIAANYL